MTANRLRYKQMPAYTDEAATSVAATKAFDGGGRRDDDFKIPTSALLQILPGVVEATKAVTGAAKPVVRWIMSRSISLSGTQHHCDVDEYGQEDDTTALSLLDWCAAIALDICEDEHDLRQLVSLTVAVAFLREKSRTKQNTSATAAELSLVWDLIHTALTRQLLAQSSCSASRSAQGFLAVPLCSLVRDGKIDELFRLHVWLPDGQRGDSNFSIHSHQPFAQSWILAGEGRDISYEVEATAGLKTATHAEYSLAWNDGKSQDKSYKTHQVFSKIVNTRKLVRTVQKGSTIHTRDMSYSVPAAAFHRTEVSPDTLHATLFFFDSRRGFVEDARVLGPIDADSSVQVRDPAGITPTALAAMVDTIRWWETCMSQSDKHVERGEAEEARLAFSRALHVCDSVKNFPHASYYRNIVLSRLETLRQFLEGDGRNDAPGERDMCKGSVSRVAITVS